MLNIIHTNLSYNGNVNEALSNDVMRAGILVSELDCPQPIWNCRHTCTLVSHSGKNFHY